MNKSSISIKTRFTRLYKMNRLRPLQFKRSISIVQQPATNYKPTTLRSAIQEDNIKDVENLVHNQSMEIAEVKALGKPPSIISVHSPPSVPVYIRRGALISLYGDGVSKGSVESSLKLFQPLVRFLYGGYVSAYQRVVSTSPFTMLISSVSSSFDIFKKSDSKSFATLFLDGTNDWAILNKTSLQMFTGNALNIRTYRVPKYHSKKISKYTSQNKDKHTGLYKWSKLGYILAGGRGHIGVVGNGTIYNITLDETEEILINRHHLIGISVNGPYDLENCVVKYYLPEQEVNDSSSEITDSSTNKTESKVSKTNTDKFTLYLNVLWSTIKKYLKGGKNTASNYIVGNEEFVRVLGPRNVLLQSSNSVFAVPQFQISSQGIPSYNSINNKVKKSSADFLNYVTIGKNGKAVIESTPDFEETVKKIERKK